MTTFANIAFCSCQCQTHDVITFLFALPDPAMLYTTCAHDPDSAKFPVKGKDKMIECFVDTHGDPRSTNYSWYLNETKLASSGGKYEGVDTRSLLVKNLEESDEGLYSCKVKNTAGLGNTASVYSLEVLCKCNNLFVCVNIDGEVCCTKLPIIVFIGTHKHFKVVC